jgi:hypothetical protein
MARKQSDDSFSEQETARRLDAILHGAFRGPPTPLKSIPTRDGGKRRLRRKQPKASASRANAKAARSRKKNPA